MTIPTVLTVLAAAAVVAALLGFFHLARVHHQLNKTFRAETDRKEARMGSQAGWFADRDMDREGGRVRGWQPCLETGQGLIPNFEVWFDSEEECERFIREVILPVSSRMAE